MGWKVLQSLTSGGMGDVHLAQTPEGQTVAVKTLPLSHHSDLTFFEQEARLLSKLRHPAIVSIFGYAVQSADIFGEDRGPCFWMEYVEGQDVLSASKNAQPERIFRWLTEALEALKFLHSQQILHGDLSPKNILIDRTGHVKLIDFGMASVLGETAMFEGATLPYMAPERIQGIASPAGDIFSLGTIFYETLAGRHPRGACHTLQEIIRSKPLPLLEVIPSLDPKFALPARTIDRMIQASMVQRFSEAKDVLEALGGGKTGGTPEAPEYHALKMVGADPSFKNIHQALARLKDHSGIFCLHGILGVGKKRFLRETAFQAALMGIPVDDFQASQLTATVGSLANKTGVFIFRSLETLSVKELTSLLAMSHEGPPRGVLVLLEWSDDGLSSESEQFLSSFLKTTGVHEIHLKNLSPEETGEFLMGALDGELAAKLTPFFHQQTAGNPLMLLELLKCLLEKGVTRGSHLEGVLAETKKVGALEMIAGHRLKSLPPEERKILTALASAHFPVEAGSLLQVTGLEDSMGSLNQLQDKQLIVRDPETHRYRLAQPPLEGALLRASPSGEICSLHQSWIECLKHEPQGSRQRLHHAVGLEDEDIIRDEAAAVAEHLYQTGHRAEALETVGLALPFLKDPDDRSRLLRLKVNVLNALGCFEEALKSSEEWFALPAHDEPARLRTVKYWFITGKIHQDSGHDEEAVRRLQRGLKEGLAAKEDPKVRLFLVRTYSLLGGHELHQRRIKQAKDFLQKGLDLADLADSGGRQRAELCRNMAEALFLESNQAEAARLFEEARRLYRGDDYDEGIFATFIQEGNLFLSEGNLDAADDCYAEAEKIARKRDDPLSLALAWTNQGIVARRGDRLATALDLLGRAQEIFRFLGNANDIIENLKYHALAEAEVGHFDRALEESKKLGDLAKTEIEATVRRLRDGDGLESPNAAEIETLKKKLAATMEALPHALQVSFAGRRDYQRWMQIKTPLKKQTKRSEKMETVEGLTTLSSILDELSTLNRDLLQEEDINRVLTRLMDMAMKLSGAENGFLVVRGDDAKSPISGFSVAVARNISKEVLETNEYVFSLSAVKHAIQTAQPIVTDNALEDPLFKDAKSIHLRKIKSILALPIIGSKGVMAVFYLDHRFQDGLFEGNLLNSMKAFAATAGLALQKGRMIDDLKRANQNLSEKVDVQTDRVEKLERELNESRLILKNEYSEIVGRSPKMVKVLSLVDRITDSKIPVWIYGESGTGKEAIARALHFNGPRAKAPFVTENCSALPESLLESELFGHIKGAFTQALRDKKGILKYADKGTIFLDEIADMSLNLQAKLLRFLQEGEIRPLGSHEVEKVDVRVISASNKDLSNLVAEGKFREDLFFRLNGVTVTLPPLRERKEDIPLLSDHFLKKIAEREKKSRCHLDGPVLKIFMTYAWPGNIRELQNTLETAVLFAEKNIISHNSLEFKPALFSSKSALPKPAASEAQASSNTPLNPELEELLLALKDQCFHRGNAAKALGISRRNLYTRLERFGVPRDIKAIKAYIDKYFH